MPINPMRRRTFVLAEDGQDLLEYTFLLVFVCLASAAMFINAGKTLSAVWNVANQTVSKGEPSYATVDVLYATDRNSTGLSKEAGFYGPGRMDDSETALQFGMCKVSIPRDHRMGQLEAPSVFKLEFREDPEKHVVLLGVTSESSDAFMKDVRGRVGRSSKKDAFVFIHGFNVTFENAARRTAQMAYDLGFEGAPILYSWPSQGKLLEYTVDETNAEWTVPHLKAFLERIAESSDAQSIHLIAHSMGGRVMMAALQQIPASSQRRFSEIVLSAPDIDADVFKRIAAQIRTPVNRVTLYASSKDDAIIASKKVHGFPRAGESGEHIVIMNGVDTVDATSVETAFIGHFYYADNLSVLSDVFYLFRDHKPPTERFGLSQMQAKAGVYWAFRH